jgi:hypothetical protein
VLVYLVWTSLIIRALIKGGMRIRDRDVTTKAEVRVMPPWAKEGGGF